jgi:hypothetical protein
MVKSVLDVIFASAFDATPQGLFATRVSTLMQLGEFSGEAWQAFWGRC